MVSMKETTVIKDIILERPSALVGLVQIRIQIIDGVDAMAEPQPLVQDLMEIIPVDMVATFMQKPVLAQERPWQH
jgi:hypothetical protein